MRERFLVLVRRRKSSLVDFVGFVVVALFTLPLSLRGVGAGLDPSWQVGLQLAAVNGFVFGRDVLFTYGPLGFLMFPMLFSKWAWFLSITVRDVIHFVFFVSLAVLAVRSEDRLVNSVMLGWQQQP